MIAAEGILAWVAENPPLSAITALRMNTRHFRCDQCFMAQQDCIEAARTQGRFAKTIIDPVALTFAVSY
jgi:hypothetical protein